MSKKGKVLFIILGVIILVWIIFFMVDYFMVKNNRKPIFCILRSEVNDGGTKEYIGLGYKVIDFHKFQGENKYYDDIKIGTIFMKYEDFKDEYDFKDDNSYNNTNNMNKENLKYKNIDLKDLPKDYTLEQAVLDGCFVISNKIYNKSRLDEFILNTSSYYTKNIIPDKLRVVQFTDEGQMIIYDVDYTKEGNYVMTRDYTRDDFSSESDRIISTSKNYSDEDYSIMKSTGSDNVEIALVSKKDDVDEYSINICSYPKSLQIEELPSFYGKIEQINGNSILVEPLEGEEERQSSDKYSTNIEKTEGYKLGDIVKVTYTGLIRESYPAQIDMVDIYIINIEKFYIFFEEKNINENTIILSKDSDKLSDYDVYTNNGDFFIIINEKVMSLKDALITKVLSVQDILDKAIKDSENEEIYSDTYLDGGTKIYKYKDYTIIKCNTLDGDKDMYLGNADFILE